MQPGAGLRVANKLLPGGAAAALWFQGEEEIGAAAAGA